MSDLQNILREYSDVKFSWGGRSDCCSFACAVVENVRGYNPMEGKFDYTNEGEARQVIAEHGSLLNTATHFLGEPTEVAGAETGDLLAALLVDGTWIIGVVINDRMAVKTEKGLMDWPLQYASHRWRT